MAHDKHPETYFKITRELCEKINSIGFDIIANELKYDEFDQLYDCYMNLKYSEVKRMREIWAESFQNETLRRAFEQPDIAKIQYEED